MWPKKKAHGGARATSEARSERAALRPHQTGTRPPERRRRPDCFRTDASNPRAKKKRAVALEATFPLSLPVSGRLGQEKGQEATFPLSLSVEHLHQASLGAIAIWLKMAILAPNLKRRPWKASWQIQFGCKIQFFAPNLDLGLLKPSGNYNLAVK